MRISGKRLKALLVTIVLATIVALYQWIALISLRAGETLAFCQLGPWMDCARVWNSSLSLAIQKYTLLPVPAWGVLWGLAAIALIFRVVFLRRQSIANESVGHGLCLLLAGAAVTATLLLIYGTLNEGLCLLCLLFYVLVYVSFLILLPGCRIAPARMIQGVGKILGPVLVIYLVLVFPAMNTPLDGSVEKSQSVENRQQSSAEEAASELSSNDIEQHPLAKFLKSLPVEMQHTLSVALFIYRTSPKVDIPVDPERLMFGKPDAPVHMVAWVDMHNCPQCRFIEEALFKLRRATPPGSWNYEVRQFPVSSECNPHIKLADPSGTSCLMAKALICTKNAAMNDLLRLNFYRSMNGMSKTRVREILENSGMDMSAISRCISSPETAKKLQLDIEDAIKNFLRGVPMITVNGRKATFHPSFLYSLILAGGRDDHPAFDVMEAPSQR
ncbi:MAG: hypothetical protein D6698_09505 [Gammaproteobacteria bacterium]|nr:MAG: hypothetical protein D6698_09505 [Gammaproteobacteria bacterium]